MIHRKQKTMHLKCRHLLSFIFIVITASACQNKTEATKLNISDPDELDAVLDQYVDEGYFPFVYARLENLIGEVMYEHGNISQNIR